MVLGFFCKVYCFFFFSLLFLELFSFQAEASRGADFFVVLLLLGYIQFHQKPFVAKTTRDFQVTFYSHRIQHMNGRAHLKGLLNHTFGDLAVVAIQANFVRE